MGQPSSRLAPQSPETPSRPSRGTALRTGGAGQFVASPRAARRERAEDAKAGDRPEIKPHHVYDSEAPLAAAVWHPRHHSRLLFLLPMRQGDMTLKDLRLAQPRPIDFDSAGGNAVVMRS